MRYYFFNKTGITQLIKFLRTEVFKEKTSLDVDNSGSLASMNYQSLMEISKTAFEDLLCWVESEGNSCENSADNLKHNLSN